MSASAALPNNQVLAHKMSIAAMSHRDWQYVLAGVVFAMPLQA